MCLRVSGGNRMFIEQITRNDIKDLFTNTVYHRGLRYYQEGRVRHLFHDPVRNIWSAKVKGSKTYEVICAGHFF